MQQNQTSSSSRNAAIELLRVALMFGICLLHSITQAGHCVRGLDNVLLSCVNGFVFISGYFGIKFKVSKVLSLIGVSLYAAFVAYGFSDFAYGTNIPFWRTYVEGYWFLWAYIVLMLVAPLCDAALEKRNERAVWSLSLPVLFAVFVWSYGCVIPGIKEVLPCPQGFGPLTYFTLGGVYLFARACRVTKIDERIQTKYLLLAWISLAVVAWAGFGHYNSPVAMLLSAASFFLFKRMSVHSSVARVVCTLSPSMFAVYILHANGVGYRTLRLIETKVIDVWGFPTVVGWMCAAIVVFVSCVLIDGLRRFVTSGVEQIVRRKK